MALLPHWPAQGNAMSESPFLQKDGRFLQKDAGIKRSHSVELDVS